MSTSFYIFVVFWLYKSLAIVIKAGARRATLKYIWGGDAATNGTGHHMQTPLHIQYHNAKLGLVTPSSRPKIKGNQWIWSNNKITWKWNKSVSPPTWCNAQLILRLLPTTTFWAVFFFVIVLFYFKIEVASFKAIDWTFSLCYHFFGFHSGAFFSWWLNPLMRYKISWLHISRLLSHVFFWEGTMGSWRTLSALILFVVKNILFADSRFLLPKERVDPVENVKGNPLKKMATVLKKNKIEKASDYLRNLAFSGFATHIVFKRKKASFTNTKIDNMFCLFHTQ